jgi:hypothetical protein
MKKRVLVISGILALSLFLTPGVIQAEGKITLSRAEEVILLPWDIRLLARIDTGATVTSLDARGLKIDGEVAEFRLPEEFGGAFLRLPIVAWRHVRSSKGRESRPVVEVDLCVASKRLRVKANLNDRSMVKYPIILGRNALKDYFIVDVKKRSKTTPPNCPDRSDRRSETEPRSSLQTSN